MHGISGSLRKFGMKHTLENEYVKIAVSEEGGELRSLYGKEEQQEYLWQGDPAFWDEQAPNLFPYIARLTEGSYTYQGKKYHMEIHGIAKYKKMQVVSERDELVLELKSDETTKECYPFDFVFRIHYRLVDRTLCVTYEVENTDKKRMYFGVGGHPGFQIPFQKDTEFEDYYLEFASSVVPDKIKMSKDCFVTGKERFDGLEDHKLLLRHSMFDDDAIILQKMGTSVTLQCRKGQRQIQMTFPDMEYLGIWHMPHTEAPYVCIEPWSSLPSRKNIIEDLEIQEDLIKLEPGKIYRNEWSISVGILKK